ncbi:MAG TPA: ABC transporter substrate-binding protein [Chloroflexota bacterium]|jgi:hypothetical protein
MSEAPIQAPGGRRPTIAPAPRRGLGAALGLALLVACAAPAAAPKPSAPAATAPTPSAAGSGGASATSAPAAQAPATQASAAPAAPNQAPAPATVHAGLMQSASDTGFFVALEQGYYAEQGLNLDVVPIQSAATMLGPLAAGQIDAGAPPSRPAF